jgi:hypothetical protein
LPVGLFCNEPVQPLSKKYSAFPKYQITAITPAVHPTEGRIAIVTNAGLDVMDAGGATDESACLRTAKPCGPDTPTLVSSRWSDPPATVAKKPVHRGERGISRKPLRAGMPGVSGELAVNTRVHSTPTTFAREAAGALGTRHSPRPLSRAALDSFTTRVQRAARIRRCIHVIASAAKQSIERQERKLDCFAALAMTFYTLHRHRPCRRVIQYSRGASD